MESSLCWEKSHGRRHWRRGSEETWGLPEGRHYGVPLRTQRSSLVTVSCRIQFFVCLVHMTLTFSCRNDNRQSSCRSRFNNFGSWAPVPLLSFSRELLLANPPQHQVSGGSTEPLWVWKAQNSRTAWSRQGSIRSQMLLCDINSIKTLQTLIKYRVRITSDIVLPHQCVPAVKPLQSLMNGFKSAVEGMAPKAPSRDTPLAFT